jgi:BlaI family transcriptional regulator, penicillinase repressor
MMSKYPTVFANFTLSMILVYTCNRIDYDCSRRIDMQEKMGQDRISDAELAVMEVLWNEAPLTATDVAARVADHRDWTLATVKTLLSRLLAKAAVEYHAEGRKFLYTPLVAREDYVKGESRRLVDRLFGGKFMPLVAHLATQEKLSAQDIAEIEALLREMKP